MQVGGQQEHEQVNHIQNEQRMDRETGREETPDMNLQSSWLTGSGSGSKLDLDLNRSELDLKLK